MESLTPKKQCAELSESNAIKYLNRVIDLLEEYKNSSNLDIINDLLERIAVSYTDYYHKCIDKVCEEYVRRDLCGLLYFYLQNVKDNLQKDRRVAMIYSALLNFSDHSEIFVKSVLSSSIHQLVIDNFLKIDSNETMDPDTKELITTSVIIINNITRNPLFIMDYRVDGIKNYIEKFIRENSNDELGLSSILVMSYLVDESEIGKLDKGLHIVKQLVMHIKDIFDTNKRSNGFTLLELVHGLRSISYNDNMKTSIDVEGGIPVLIGILKSKRENAFEETLGTIENLCFDENIRDKLKKEYNIEKVLKHLEKNKDKNIKKRCEGILWKVQNKGEAFHTTAEKSSPRGCFDVFMSYSWANKDGILKIFEKMKSRKIRVWLDEEQMQGSSITAMAKGIESSKTFVMAISSSYKRSENCRHEAEYAFQIKKPIIPIVMELKYKPSSWLGFIVGTKVYYEFSDRRNPEVESDKLIRAVVSRIENKEVKEKHDDNHSSNFCNPVTENWSNDDVLKWLEDWQLGYLKQYFVGIDGSFIHSMLKVRETSTEYFNNCLKTEFGMKFFDVIKFHMALDSIHV